MDPPEKRKGGGGGEAQKRLRSVANHRQDRCISKRAQGKEEGESCVVIHGTCGLPDPAGAPKEKGKELQGGKGEGRKRGEFSIPVADEKKGGV